MKIQQANMSDNVVQTTYGKTEEPIKMKEKKLCGPSPRANYTDRMTTACR
jgi:hypothetical protein